MNYDDADCQTVSDLTDEWIRCVADKNVERVREIITSDFIYSRHPALGEATLSKQQMLDFMPSIEESNARVVEQYMHRFADVILVHNVTVANQKVAVADESANPERNKSFLNKRLLDSSSWRREGGLWRCYDYRLVDAID
jgi:hypothetical protein